jgi:hypothetical protein
MNRIFFCFAISILTLINNVSAQDNSQNINPDSLINKRLVRMQKELNLNQQQLNSIKLVLPENNRKNEQLKKDIDGIRELKKKNDQNADSEMSKILTPEQYQKYQEKRLMIKTKKTEARIKQRMAYYRDELKLSDQQYNDLKLLIEQTVLSRKELKNKYKDDNEILKQELKKIRSENQEQLKKILNQEQLLKFKQLNKFEKS